MEKALFGEIFTNLTKAHEYYRMYRKAIWFQQSIIDMNTSFNLTRSHHKRG